MCRHRAGDRSYNWYPGGDANQFFVYTVRGAKNYGQRSKHDGRAPQPIDALAVLLSGLLVVLALVEHTAFQIRIHRQPIFWQALLAFRVVQSQKRTERDAVAILTRPLARCLVVLDLLCRGVR